MTSTRKLPLGAELVQAGVHFRVFAPKRKCVDVVVERGDTGDAGTFALTREASGHFSGFVPNIGAGALYRYRLDDGDAFPDPASRFQPSGPHGPSEVIDTSRFEWTDDGWRGVTLRGQVVYELHIGTFTKEGTYAAAARELPELRAAGITLIEMMPVAEFPGNFGWGYDGVDLFAPTRLYGRPDDLRAFINRAHEVGIGVILDVVYNHLGPSGNYLKQFSDAYFTNRYPNEWGDALDFETEKGARELFVENAAYWVSEFHFDGLRLDATQSIFDSSTRHVIAELGERARRAAGPNRKIVLIAENEPQDARCVRSTERGGHGLDAMWNDDFHHSARAAATGRTEAYYVNTKGTPQELLSATKWGFLFQGQYYPWQRKCRGVPAFDLAPPSFVLYLQNHDQVANSSRGQRLHQLTGPGKWKALTTLLLLAPGTPMLFQGQEFAASSPFLYFADHEPELAALVAKGRTEFIEQFPSARDEALRCATVAPHDPRAFERCKLDLSEREKHAAAYDLHKDLLRLRREDPVFSAQRSDWLHGAVLSQEAFVLRYATGTGDDRLMLVNLGADLDLTTVAEPLLAPPADMGWSLLFSTEAPRYGGCGTPPFGRCGQLTVPGQSALVLVASREARREQKEKDAS